MITKNNFTVDGALKITSLPVVSNTLSTLMEQDGNVVRRALGTIATSTKESYLPSISVSFPALFNLNTQSLDYNNRNLVVSLANQLQGTALMAPSTMNGTPAFRKIVKSDLNLASVIFDDDNRLHTHTNKSVLDGITSTKVSNWDAAFSWGDFRKYGLGLTGLSTTWSSVDLDSLKAGTHPNSFIIANASSGLGQPTGFSYSLGIHLNASVNVRGDIVLNHTGANKMAFRTSGRDWSEVWHDGNLTKLSQLTNDLGFVTSDTKYTAGNGLALSNTNVFSVAGGNGLVANASGLSLGTPSSVTATSTNSLTTASHTHELVGVTVTFSSIGMGTKLNGPVSGATGGPISGSVMGNWTTLNSNTAYGSGFFARNNQAWFLTKENGVLQTWNELAKLSDIKTYTAGAGLTLSGTAFSLPVTQSGSGNYISSVVQTTGGITVTKATLPIPALVTSTTATGTTNVATTNTNTYLNIVSGGVATGSSTKVVGAGSVTVASNTAGQLTITGTNTTYSTGTLQQLQTGADTVGRLQTSKNLNDWLDSKYVPTTQVFEKTLQGGLKVKDWDGLANKLGAISIGQGAQATKINSLALVSGSSADGNSSIAIGINAQSLAIRSISLAPNSTNNAPDSAIMGVGLLNNQKGCTVVGNYNNPIKQEVNVEVDETSPLFIIGNGKDSMLKSNSLEHYADGSTRYFGRQYYNRETRQESWFEDPNTLVDVQYIRNNGAGLTPNPSNLPIHGFSGDVIEGQSSYASKSGEFVYFDNNGIWQRVAIGGASLNSQKFGVTFGIWLTDGKVLLRGYYRSDMQGSTVDRGKAYYYKAQDANLAPQLVSPSSVGRNDIFLGTVITNTSVIFFNPR